MDLQSSKCLIQISLWCVLEMQGSGHIKSFIREVKLSFVDALNMAGMLLWIHTIFYNV